MKHMVCALMFFGVPKPRIICIIVVILAYMLEILWCCRSIL